MLIKRINVMSIELTTMCAVFKGNSVLMINRKRNWCGWAFPGGHLENNESLVECVKRELWEETGVFLEQVKFKGITNIYNTVTGARHIIFNYCAECSNFDAKAECDEGTISWIDIDKISDLDLAEGMNYRLPLFLKRENCELYIEWDSQRGYTSVEYNEV